MTVPTARAISLPFVVACAGIASYTAMDGHIKYASLTIGAYSALLWRLLIGGLVAAVVQAIRRARWPGRAAMSIHLLRGTVAAGMALLWFWGLQRLPMAIALALSFIAPVLAIGLAALMLGEKVSRQSLGGVAVCVAGVAVITVGALNDPHSRVSPWGIAAIFGSALLYAYNIILMRRQSLIAGSGETALFMTVVPALWLLPAAPFYAVAAPPALWPALVWGAMLAFASLLLLAWAYRHAQAQQLAPVEFTGFIWAALFGWLWFSEPVAVATVAGAGLIAAGSLIAATQRSSSPSVDSAA